MRSQTNLSCCCVPSIFKKKTSFLPLEIWEMERSGKRLNFGFKKRDAQSTSRCPRFAKKRRFHAQILPHVTYFSIKNKVCKVNFNLWDLARCYSLEKAPFLRERPMRCEKDCLFHHSTFLLSSVLLFPVHN